MSKDRQDRNSELIQCIKQIQNNVKKITESTTREILLQFNTFKSTIQTYLKRPYHKLWCVIYVLVVDR